MEVKVDPEIAAMSAVFEALSQLDEVQRRRVIQWVSSRYDIDPKALKRTPKPDNNADDEADDDEIYETPDVTDNGWEHFADLFSAADPKTEAYKLLVAAYWAHVVQGQTSFGSFSLNKDLKDLGHGATHTATSMDRLVKERPQLVLQLKKSGKSQQARKIYKLTDAGKKAVEHMIANGA